MLRAPSSDLHYAIPAVADAMTVYALDCSSIFQVRCTDYLLHGLYLLYLAHISFLVLSVRSFSVPPPPVQLSVGERAAKNRNY